MGLGCAAATADPLPMPTADFNLKANLPGGASMDMAFSHGLMRVDVNRPGAPAGIMGVIDLNGRRMFMMTPQMPKVALEIALPPEYVVGALAGTGTKTGTSEVAGEPCNIWQVDPPVDRKMGPTQACITNDGIALRTEAVIEGKTRTLYEVTRLTRGPQETKLFLLPPGVKVMKVPKGKIGAALGLPQAPTLSAQPAPPAAPPAKPQ